MGFNFSDNQKRANSKAIIYQSELDYISRCILDYPDIETGGDFFGFWTHTGCPVVQYVIGPGPQCYRTGSFFKQDLDYLVKIGGFLNRRHGLQHIGSWHSHHKLGLAVPSGHDSSTMDKAIKNSKLNKFLMILGNIPKDDATTINGFLFDNENGTDYSTIDWVVLKEKNPLRSDLDSVIAENDLYLPETKIANIVQLKEAKPDDGIRFKPLAIEPDSWLDSKKGKGELKHLHNNLNTQFDGLKMLFSEGKVITLEFTYHDNKFNVSFLPDFPQSMPIIRFLKNSEVEILNLSDVERNEKYNYKNADSIIDYISKYVYNSIENNVIV